MDDYKKPGGNKGCLVEDGIGCHYKGYDGWCKNCKKERIKPKSPTWEEKAKTERKYIRI